jgi:ubiquinone/menaquinone biosynthesis C-methylase UbiE
MDVEKERLSANFLMPNWVATEHRARFLFAAKFTNGKTVIDCACGNGQGTAIFSVGSKETLGFDVSEEAITEAKQNCAHPNTRFALASGTALPVANQFADIYVSLETIEHIHEAEDFLREVNRVLKTGGTFICSTPNRHVTGPGKRMADKPANIFHVREYTVQEFETLLKKYFSHVEMHGQNQNSVFKTNLLNALGKILPFHLAVRLHQANKLLLHFFRNQTYYQLKPHRPGEVYEYVTAVCTK